VNQINPKKLMFSKWTALTPTQREKHFIVTAVEYENNSVVSCQLEAVLTGNEYMIDWKSLKDKTDWLMGWK
jgi:tryptophan-rich hypothetical protein